MASRDSVDTLMRIQWAVQYHLARRHLSVQQGCHVRIALSIALLSNTWMVLLHIFGNERILDCSPSALLAQI